MFVLCCVYPGHRLSPNVPFRRVLLNERMDRQWSDETIQLVTGNNDNDNDNDLRGRPVQSAAMPPRQPVLGSEAIHNPPSTSRVVNVNASTCLNLSLFKGLVPSLVACHANNSYLGWSIELMKEYRKVDDSVTMRMNRTTAQFRDRDRMGMSESTRNSQDQACAYFWMELVGMLAPILHLCTPMHG